MQRLCSRCRGASEQTAQFCRFCGASLADAQAVPIQPSANPIGASPAAPAPAPAPVAARAPVAPTAPPEPVPAPRAPPPAPAAAPPAAAPPAVAHAPPVAAAATRARLVLIARDGGEGPSYPLGESTDIGRTEGNIVIAEDRYISPRHARIAMRGGSFYVRDLESTNGVFVRIPFPRALTGGGNRTRGSQPTPSRSWPIKTCSW